MQERTYIQETDGTAYHLHLVINALREYYGACIGVSGERQKFLRLMQNEDESIDSWETHIQNQASQYEYENFADEFMTDRWTNSFID